MLYLRPDFVLLLNHADAQWFTSDHLNELTMCRWCCTSTCSVCIFILSCCSCIITFAFFILTGWQDKQIYNFLNSIRPTYNEVLRRELSWHAPRKQAFSFSKPSIQSWCTIRAWLSWCSSGLLQFYCSMEERRMYKCFYSLYTQQLSVFYFFFLLKCCEF